MSDHPSARQAARKVVAFPAVPGLHESGSVSGSDADFDSEADTEADGERRGQNKAESSAEKQARRAANVSLAQLARRGMSRWELEQVLAKREIDADVASAQLDRLEDSGLLDEEGLADSLVFSLHSRKGLSRSAIAQELKRRHVDPAAIERALDQIEDDEEQLRATELAIKRVGQLSSYDDETAKRRLHGFLARKGYSSEIVRHAMDAALATRSKRGVRFQ
ncbi:regulatory protein RecX [Leifsonia poae]|uniref:regulatory protein RecX n=1 Tax=Leifsonia poae TaxID=110933 RepID=UPI003D67FBF5